MTSKTAGIPPGSELAEACKAPPRPVAVAVTALAPGWRNIYRHADGSVAATPCPAILVEKTRREDRSPVRRAFYAGTWPSSSHLVPAQEPGCYVGTIGPGQDPAEIPAQCTPSECCTACSTPAQEESPEHAQ